MQEFPELTTKRLNLVEIKQDNLKDIFELFGNSRVTQYYNVKTLSMESEAQKYIDWFQCRFSEGAGIRWGIALQGQKNIIGTIGFNNFTKKHRANLGYDLQPNFWNKGYMTEALNAVLQYGFRILDINRIEAEVMVDNIQSGRLLSKLGFTNEGVLRQWMYWSEKHYDMIMFSLLSTEFQEIHKNGI